MLWREPHGICNSLSPMNTTTAAAIAALATALILGAAACGDDSPDDNAATTETESTAPDETATPATTDAVDTTSGAGTTAGSGTSADAETAPADTALSTEMTVEEAEEALVGLSEQDAADVADDRGWTIRVVVLDGEDRPMTMDFRPNRVNVEVADGEVVAIVSTG